MAAEPHDFARRLRKSSTKFEDVLWQQLRSSRLTGAKFKRQVPFGRYVVDLVLHVGEDLVHAFQAFREADLSQSLS
jgi:very-short-patch-repair endonuclease